MAEGRAGGALEIGRIAHRDPAPGLGLVGQTRVHDRRVHAPTLHAVVVPRARLNRPTRDKERTFARHPGTGRSQPELKDRIDP